MSETNPWDETPSCSKKPKKTPVPMPQIPLSSRLKANILSDQSDVHQIKKVEFETKLANIKSRLLHRRNSHPLSSFPSNESDFTIRSENSLPISFKNNVDLTSHHGPNFEAGEKLLTSSSRLSDVTVSVPRNPNPTQDELFRVNINKRIIGKTGSFMSLPACVLDETTEASTGIACPKPEKKQTTDFSDSIAMLSPLSPNAALKTDELCLPQSSSENQLHVLPNVTTAAKINRAPPSGNYLKLNLRKKCFSRHGTRRQALNRLQVRRIKFAKKLGPRNPTLGKCFKCNQTGHWASKCPKTISERRVQLKKKEVESMEFDYSRIKCRIADLAELQNQFANGPQLYDLLSVDSETLKTRVPFIRRSLNLDIKEVRSYTNELLNQMGIKEFRPGQERVIWRTIAGKSTLLVLPTAGGKSLCYQIPAAVFQKFFPSSIAVVISPLISLMRDQVLSSTSPIRGAYLSSTQTKEEKEEILKAVDNGQYAYILMSPEALVESDWILRQNRLSSISFVCIDEAHCLADWSHHFRPSYLQICSLLKTRFGVRQFLGLSATCTPSTIKNICQNLGMADAVKLDAKFDRENPLDFSDPDGGFLQPFPNPIPSNLLVTASMDRDREEALIHLLQRPPFSEQLSILIYAASRDLTERLAGYIRTRLQDTKMRFGRRTIGWNTAAYHAGLTSKQRELVQKRFMLGRVRVLVATSAFGMGLNKQDLQAVIHYSLPKSFENFVQEIGRAGRNGQLSYCHTFLPPGFPSIRTQNKGADTSTPVTWEEACEANELRRHIFTNHIDSVQLKRLLHFIFGANLDTSNNHFHQVVALDPDQIAEQLDIKLESLATLITYMQLRSDLPPLITVLPSRPMRVTVNCYGGPFELASISTRSLAVSAWLAHLKQQTADFTTATLREVNIDLVALCNTWGWQPDAVLRELRNLEWDNGANNGAPPRRTGVTVTLDGPTRAFWLWLHPDNKLSERLDAELLYLRRRLKDVERAGLRSLTQLQTVIALVAVESVDRLDFTCDSVFKRSERMHAQVEMYFMEELESPLLTWPPQIPTVKEQLVRRTVGEFIRLHGRSLSRDQLTGRVVANIFHGISSPNFPAIAWSRVHRFWRAHLDVDWPTVQRLATEELVAYQPHVV